MLLILNKHLSGLTYIHRMLMHYYVTTRSISAFKYFDIHYSAGGVATGAGLGKCAATLSPNHAPTTSANALSSDTNAACSSGACDANSVSNTETVCLAINPLNKLIIIPLHPDKISFCFCF